MGVMVIAIYKPDAGQEDALLALAARHEDVLRTEELVTDRPFTLLQADDGTFLELFEWINEDAANNAHANERVSGLWQTMGEVASFPPGKDLPAFEQSFSHFKIVENYTP